MTIDNLVLEQLRLIRTDIAEFKTEIDSKLSEMTHRLTQVELGVAALRRDAGHDALTIAGQDARYDRLALRIDRIEKRLQLID